MSGLTEADVRRIAMVEAEAALARAGIVPTSDSDGLGDQGRGARDVGGGAAFQDFQPVLNTDDRADQNRYQARKVLDGVLRGMGVTAEERREILKDLPAAAHGVGERVDGVADGGGDGGHGSSPSSVGGAPIVGGGVASGDELRAHTSDATTPPPVRSISSCVHVLPQTVRLADDQLAAILDAIKSSPAGTGSTGRGGGNGAPGSVVVPPTAGSGVTGCGGGAS